MFAPLEAGAHVVRGGLLDDEPALALADGVAADRRAGRAAAHRRPSRRRGAGRGFATASGCITGGDDGRVVATIAAGETIERSPTRRAAGSTRWRRAAERSPGPRASRRAPATPPAPSSPGARRPRCAGSAFCRRAIDWRSPITTAFRSGSPTPPPSRRCWSGKARISTPPSRRTDAFSSPRCRRMLCTAGGSPIRATCG